MFTALLLAAPQIYAFFGGNTDKRAEINLLRTQTNEVVTLSARDYVKGCLLAQIPINYSPEALKAQAVCAYTYALRFISENEKADVKQVEGADISDSPSLCQPYFSEAEARALYGTDYDLYIDNINAAADFGAAHILTYHGEPIYSVYHSVSAGVTCTADTVWGFSLPYLQPAASPWDKEYINFICKNEMTEEVVRQKLIAAYPDADVPVDFAKWFSETERDENGYVRSVRLGGLRLSGGDMWRIFGLRSTAFDISYSSGIFTFTTAGYGHGAGLSQYGAEALAKKGFAAEDILRYYFSGVKIG